MLALVVGMLAANPASAEQPAALDLAAHRGRVVYLDFWASWCVPCRQSFPWMNAMQEKYGAQGLVVIAVNLDREQEKAQRFLEKTPAAFRVVYDPAGGLARTYDLQGMPSSYLIDRTGQIQAQHVGFVPAEADAYERRIAELLR